MLKPRDRLSALCFGVKQKYFRGAAYTQGVACVAADSLTKEDLENINLAKRQKLLEHVRRNVPFYKKRLEGVQGLDSDVTEETWRKIPLLRKRDLQNCVLELVAEGVAPRYLRPSTTGGSTGVPTKVYHDLRFPAEILGWRMYRWWGLRPGTDVAYCWRLTRLSVFSRFVNSLMWWPTRRIWLDASCISEANLKDFIKRFNHLKPPLLHGYVGGIDHLASYVEQQGIQIHRPQAVSVTSAPVSLLQRKRIERVFHAPVFDQYGCGEVYWLAAECSMHHGLHIFSDFRHIEFLRDDGEPCADGEYGRIVVTDLENYAFPIIRYEIGDVGRRLPGQCSCGMAYPTMDAVRGRTTDVLKLTNGTAIAGDYITTLFDDFPDSVEGFQVVQHADYHIELRVVPRGNAADVSRALVRVVEILRSKVGSETRIVTTLTEAIESDRGKTRYVVSHVAG